MKFPLYESTNDKVSKFINTLAPIVVNEYLYRKSKAEKVISPTVVIAQAALESGWNLDSPSLFGIKGDGDTYETREFVDGRFITIKESFKKYKSLHDAVKGYYDLMQWDNYDDATSALPVEPEIEGLTNDIGYAYATDPDYGKKVLDIINDFDLRIFNDYVYQSNMNGKIIRLYDDICVIELDNGDIYNYKLLNTLKKPQ